MKNTKVIFYPPPAPWIFEYRLVLNDTHYRYSQRDSQRPHLEDDIITWLNSTVPDWLFWAGDEPDYEDDPALIGTFAFISFKTAADMIAFKLRWMGVHSFGVGSRLL